MTLTIILGSAFIYCFDIVEDILMASQILATVIFVLMFVMIVWEKVERHITTLISAALVIVFVFLISMKSPQAVWEAINLKAFVSSGFWYSSGASELSSGINWETIVFITGMMVMVEGMGRAGFFRWLCLKIAKAVNYKTVPILITFMVMSSLLSMFIDSITVILFLAAVSIELSRILEFDPVPIIISEIFCANLGGSATMCGDPPNIIIGTSLGYTFGDFFSNTGVISFICIVFTILYFYLCFKKRLKASELKRTGNTEFPDPAEAITSKKGFIISTIIFIIAIILLVTHAQTKLTVSSIGIIIAFLTIITSPKNVKYILSHLDYKTLLFFIGLFIVVSGLEQTKVLELIADFIGNASSGNKTLIIIIVIWISAIASAFVDNIPFAATMIPVITTMAVTQNMELSTLAWALSLGTDLGGNATPIGASANVMGISVAGKNGHKITWGKYCLYSAPATIIVVAVCTAYILLRYL